MTERSKRKDITVDRKDSGPPKVRENHPKWEVNCRFELFIRKKGIVCSKKGILDLK